MPKDKAPKDRDGMIYTSENARYWIYIMSSKLFSEFEQIKAMYLCWYLKQDIKKDDIIFIYVKHRKSSGFAGICKASTDLILNPNTKVIFKDYNLNRCIFELADATLFDKPVPLRRIFEEFDTRFAEFKNERAFKMKYLTDCDYIHYLDRQGPVLLRTLFKATSMISPDTEEEMKRKNETMKVNNKVKKVGKKKGINLIETESPDEESQMNHDDDTNDEENEEEAQIDQNERSEEIDRSYSSKTKQSKIEKKDAKEKKNYERSSDDEEIADSEEEFSGVPEISSDADEDIDSEQDEEMNENVEERAFGLQSNDENEDHESDDSDESDEEPQDELIPIMWVPCSDFDLPEKNREKYLKEHYMKCKKCDRTNNNSIELSPYLENAMIDFEEINTKKDRLFENAMDAYLEGVGYYPPRAKTEPFVRFQFIENDHRYYEGCILITWCI